MSKANGGNPSGKVRPAWMGGAGSANGATEEKSPKTEEAAEGAAQTPPKEGTPRESGALSGVKTTQQTAGTENTGAEKAEAKAENANHRAPATTPEEPPPEPEESKQEKSEEYTAESATGSAPARAGRSGPLDPANEQATRWTPPAGGPLVEPPSPDYGRSDQDSPGALSHQNPSGKEPAPSGLGSAISAFVGRLFGNRRRRADAPPQESPAEVERRLKLSLRQTGVRDFCRVCFGSPKGGVGKSSMAYAVAGAISQGTNLRVALVDADPNFGATRFLVPRPIQNSGLDLAEDAAALERLADLRQYVSQNELMGLDVILNPVEASQIARVDDLAEAYERIDSVLSRFYDLVIYDLGLGFRDPAIRRVLSLSDELVFVSDSEVITNAMLSEAVRYVENLGVDLGRTTLVLNHRQRRKNESADTSQVREKLSDSLRRITEIPYDAAFSTSLNARAFHVDHLELDTRLGVLTTAGAVLEGLQREGPAAAYKKVVSLPPSTDPRAYARMGGV